MHFFYGVGAFLTPIVVKFFLNTNINFKSSSSFECYNIQNEEEFIKEKLVESSNEHNFMPVTTMINASNLYYSNRSMANFPTTSTKFTSQTKYAFWILSVIQLPAPIFLFLIKVFDRRLPNYSDLELQESSDNAHTNDDAAGYENSSEMPSFSFSRSYFQSLSKNKPIFQLTILMSVMVFFFEGLQVKSNRQLLKILNYLFV